MTLALSFDPNLSHQRHAIEHVVDLLVGVPRADTSFRFDDLAANLPFDDDLDEKLLGRNLAAVQRRYNAAHRETEVPLGDFEVDDGIMLEGVSNDSHRCPHFTVEMETGTGKTYVYLRTLHELYARYGLHKFLIVVPSVAILEGVKKAFESMRTHFVGLYGQTNFALIEYDGKRPQCISSFTRRSSPAVLLMTLQAFNKRSNNLFKHTEKLAGERRPFEWIQAVRPVVVLDEPQNMGTAKAQAALRTLRPLFVLRYSATHRADQQPNLVYRLTPLQAFHHGLVKQIEVVGVAELGLDSTGLLRVDEVLRRPVRARLRALTLRKGQSQEQTIEVRTGDSLFKYTRLPEHRDIEVGRIKAPSGGDPGHVELVGGPDGGRLLSTSEEIVGSRREVWRAQLRQTIAVHLKRQEELRPLGVKVLSLFFIDRVDNFEGEPGTIRRLFDEVFDELKMAYPAWRDLPAERVRERYFAVLRKKNRRTGVEDEVFLDEVKADSDEAKAAFQLIMAGRERLLSFPDGRDPGKDVAFIFAHSALKEGWDNPNVFQICTLNQTRSQTRKRQEIGRGLRLCVDQDGNRPDAPGLNVLTVVANESYEAFADGLQREYQEDGDLAPPPPRRRRDAQAHRRDHLFRSAAFQDFWRKLCTPLDYDFHVEPEVLVADAVKRLHQAPPPEPEIAISRGRVVFIEYQFRVTARLGPDRARITCIAETTAHEDRTLLPPGPQTFDVEVGTKLWRLVPDAQSEHFRGMRVVAIVERLGELRVEFANDIACGEVEVLRLPVNVVRPRAVTIVRPEEAPPQPLPDIIGRAAETTGLTRATLIEIFRALPDTHQRSALRNPEGFANRFIAEISEALRDHVAERIEFRVGGVPRLSADPSALFPETVSQPQKELLEGGDRSLYDKVQIDSEVERVFVRDCVMPDQAHVEVYFKFPPRFKIPLPEVIGNYNPDWGIVRLMPEGATVELVRETKGQDDIDRLRFANEGRKIRAAKRFFARLGIDYRAMAPHRAYWEPEPAPDLQATLRLPAAPPTTTRLAPVLSFRPVSAPRIDGQGLRTVPVLDFAAAAGVFGPSRLGLQRELDGADRWAEIPDYGGALSTRHFIGRTAGDSMTPVIPPGSHCLFRTLDGPPADGDLVLAELADVVEGDDGGGYAVKRYARNPDGAFELRSMNPAYGPIVLSQDVRVVAVVEHVLGAELPGAVETERVSAQMGLDAVTGEDDFDDESEEDELDYGPDIEAAVEWVEQAARPLGKAEILAGCGLADDRWGEMRQAMFASGLVRLGQGRGTRYVSWERVCDAMVEAIEVAGSEGLNKAELLDALQSAGFALDGGEDWRAAIQVLCERGRVQKSGRGRGTRYRVPDR